MRYDYSYVKKFIEKESQCGCILLSEEYTSIKNNLLIQCKCGQQFITSFDKFLNRNKRQCNKCGRKGAKLKTTEKFKEEVYEFVGNEYTVLGEYEDALKKILIRHNCNKCSNHEYGVTPANFLYGYRCPKCFRLKLGDIKRSSLEKYKEEVYKLVGDEYIVTDIKYINNRTPIKMIHNISSCMNEFFMHPSNFIKGQRCPKCADKIRHDKQRKTQEQFVNEVYLKVGNEYEILSEYKGASEKVKFKHTLCNNVYLVSPHNFLNGGNRCPVCNESTGERIIRDYLTNKDIKFIPQYSFSDLIGINGGLLRFDFAVFDKDSNLICLIEYDGEFHYIPLIGMKQLRMQIKNDKLKNIYCDMKDLHLIRIPYWKFDNIEDILYNTVKL